MKLSFVVRFFSVLCSCIMANEQDEFLYATFPKDFMWGVSSSAYQIEGGWDADGKGPSIWDTFTHASAAAQTGDVACDSYHRVDEDVKLLKNLGVSFYRFSISWSRVLPKGTVDEVNLVGVEYYQNLISLLLENNITPMVTLYHFDLPQALQDQFDGWLNPKMVDLFNDYAKFCFEAFGNRVKWWITFNEPWEAALLAHGLGIFPPNKKDIQSAPYKVAYITLLAHAKAWHTYDQEFRPIQQGKLSIILNTNWGAPKTDKQADRDAADRYMEWWLGWFAHPVFVNGDWPEVMKTTVMKNSEAKGIPNRLPEFTEEEKSFIKGTGDFFALNMYSTSLIEHKEFPHEVDWDYLTDRKLKESSDPSWQKGAPDWLYNTPWGLRKLLSWIKQSYNNPEIIITENGFAVDGESELERDAALKDTQRVEYVKAHVNEVLKAIQLDGVRVKGYFVWALMDNLEWTFGYHFRFGIHHVDFDDPNRPRTPKRSAQVYREIIRYNGFPRYKEEKTEL